MGDQTLGRVLTALVPTVVSHAGFFGKILCFQCCSVYGYIVCTGLYWCHACTRGYPVTVAVTFKSILIMVVFVKYILLFL